MYKVLEKLNKLSKPIEELKDQFIINEAFLIIEKDMLVVSRDFSIVYKGNQAMYMASFQNMKEGCDKRNVWSANITDYPLLYDIYLNLTSYLRNLTIINPDDCFFAIEDEKTVVVFNERAFEISINKITTQLSMTHIGDGAQKDNFDEILDIQDMTIRLMCKVVQIINKKIFGAIDYVEKELNSHIEQAKDTVDLIQYNVMEANSLYIIKGQIDFEAKSLDEKLLDYFKSPISNSLEGSPLSETDIKLTVTGNLLTVDIFYNRDNGSHNQYKAWNFTAQKLIDALNNIVKVHPDKFKSVNYKLDIEPIVD